MTWAALAALAGAYLSGSVNFSILVLRLLGRGDPRRGGSGNAGTTNVYRLAGPVWAALVLVLDLGRALAVAWVAQRVLPQPWVPWVGLALVLGNHRPCFHGFAGGKGVANYLGFTLALRPEVALLGGAAWLLGRLVGRASFVGSLLMVAVLAGGTLWGLRPGPWGAAGALLTVALICWTHRDNWRRRQAG